MMSSSFEVNDSAAESEWTIQTDLFELAVLLFRHDLLHGVPGTNTQGPRLDALQRHVGAEREPLINHLALLQTVQLTTHEH